MAGYTYLIAGLPDLAESLSGQEQGLEEAVDFIKEHCPAEGRRCIDWLESALKSDHKRDTFYRAAARSRSRFICEYTAFDRQVRTAKVAFLEAQEAAAGSAGNTATGFAAGSTATASTAGHAAAASATASTAGHATAAAATAATTTSAFPEGERLAQIFATGNILEREKALDLLYWHKAEEIVAGELFNIEPILAFIAKADIAQRWRRLDPASGAELFSRLVDEVRGTFDRKTIQTI